MQVGCHISVALKGQLILKIVYDKEPFFVVFLGCFAQKLSRKFVINISLVILRNTTTEIWQPVWPAFVQNSGWTKLHKAIFSVCNRSVASC